MAKQDEKPKASDDATPVPPTVTRWVDANGVHKEKRVYADGTIYESH
jgi:ketosteroid isomerase-like protein